MSLKRRAARASRESSGRIMIGKLRPAFVGVLRFNHFGLFGQHGNGKQGEERSVRAQGRKQSRNNEISSPSLFPSPL